MQRYIRQPFLALSHAVGVPIGVFGASNLLSWSDTESAAFYGLLVYCLSFIFLFGASSLFHGIKHLTEDREDLFERLDYAAIYLFIAGTYTPVCLMIIRGSLGWTLLTAQWIAALAGSFLILRGGMKRNRWQVFIFLAMGWSFLFASSTVLRALDRPDTILLAIGAACYTFGAAVFSLAPPKICRDRICTHSVWHLLVLTGAIAHLALIHDIALAQTR